MHSVRRYEPPRHWDQTSYVGPKQEYVSLSWTDSNAPGLPERLSQDEYGVLISVACHTALVARGNWWKAPAR